MTDFLVWLIISSFWIWGVHFCFMGNQIFGKTGEWLNKRLPKWMCKPLFLCPMCMASIHGTVIFLLSGMTYHFECHLFFVVALCGLNDIIDGLTADYD